MCLYYRWAHGCTSNLVTKNSGGRSLPSMLKRGAAKPFMASCTTTATWRTSTLAISKSCCTHKRSLTRLRGMTQPLTHTHSCTQSPLIHQATHPCSQPLAHHAPTRALQSPTHTLSHPLMNAPSHPPPPSAACSYSRYLETRKRAIFLFEHYPVLDFEIEPGRGTARQRFYEGLYVNMKLVPLAPFRETSTNRYCYVHNICICLHRHTQNQHSPNHLPPTHTHWSWKRSRSERILVCVHACARVCECKRILVCVCVCVCVLQ